MGLKLSIVSDQRTRLGARASIVFGVDGGSIGRARDNDWVLPDPQRYLSAHHARVQFRHGNYYIEDLSTNGLYLNDADKPLGRRNAQPLRDGDRLRFGDYRVEVSVDAQPDAHAEASAIVAFEHPPPTGDLVSTQGDIGAQLNVQELLRAERAAASGMVPVDAFGQAIAAEDTGLRVFDSGQRPAPEHTRIPAALRRELRAAGSGVSSEGGSPIEAFCRGAGIDPTALPADAQIRLLHLTGLLLRETLVGIKAVAVAQQELRNASGLATAPEDPERTALQGLAVEDLLVRLLLGHDKRQLDAVQWLRDTFAAVRRHDEASAQALQPALAEFIARLDPRELARFRSITEMPAGKLPHFFAEAFARAFMRVYSAPGGQNNG
jgi:type VI secretion system protein